MGKYLQTKYIALKEIVSKMREMLVAYTTLFFFFANNGNLAWKENWWEVGDCVDGDDHGGFKMFDEKVGKFEKRVENVYGLQAYNKVHKFLLRYH